MTVLQKLLNKKVLIQTKLKWQIFFFMVNEIFTRKNKKLMENNSSELYVFE